MDEKIEDRIRRQVTEFVGELKEQNRQSQQRGAPRISEAEYRQLTNDLVNQVVKRANGGLHAQ